jgi:hypothetical protein
LPEALPTDNAQAEASNAPKSAGINSFDRVISASQVEHLITGELKRRLQREV